MGDRTWTATVRPDREGDAAAAARLFAREQVEDLEVSRAAGEAAGPIDRRIEALGLRHQIATRLTSWVAISDAATVDPNAPFRKTTMPHELAEGLSAEGEGLRPALPSGPLGEPFAVTAAFRGAAGATHDTTGALGLTLKRLRSPQRSRSAPPADSEELITLDEAAPDMLPAAPDMSPAAPTPNAAPAAKGSLPGRGWWASVTFTPDGMRFEVTCTSGGLWAPGEVVTLVMVDGEEVEARVVESTHAGSVQPGVVARLLVDAHGPAPAYLIVDGQPIEVVP